MSTAFPPKVATAIAEVMSGVKTLAKSNENQHGRYKFAGIDDFLEATRPLCAAAGLLVLQDEESCDIIGEGAKPWLRITYGFRLAHASGECWDGVMRRTIMVQAAMGSQAFGAAQSYVLKQFMRSLFQMATGDGEDADTHAQSNLPAARKDYSPSAVSEDFHGSNGERGKSSYAAKKDGTDKRFNELRAEIAELESPAACGAWAAARAEEIKAMPEAWRRELRGELDTQRHLVAQPEEMEPAE